MEVWEDKTMKRTPAEGGVWKSGVGEMGEIRSRRGVSTGEKDF